MECWSGGEGQDLAEHGDGDSRTSVMEWRSAPVPGAAMSKPARFLEFSRRNLSPIDWISSLFDFGDGTDGSRFDRHSKCQRQRLLSGIEREKLLCVEVPGQRDV
jgi:hypothetical protein